MWETKDKAISQILILKSLSYLQSIVHIFQRKSDKTKNSQLSPTKVITANITFLYKNWGLV